MNRGIAPPRVKNMSAHGDKIARSQPQLTACLKDRQPHTLIGVGRNNPLMLPAVTEFVKQVVPAADLRYFDASYLTPDENADSIAEAIIEKFSR